MNNHFCDKFLVHDSLYNLDILDYPDYIYREKKKDIDHTELFNELSELCKDCVIELPRSGWNFVKYGQ